MKISFSSFFSIVSVVFILSSCNRQTLVESVTLSESSVVLTEGEKCQLSYVIYPEDADDQTVSWYSKDPNLASVINGQVTALSPGETYIGIKTNDGEKTDECKVTVVEKIYDVESVSLNETSVKMEVGEKMRLIATVLPENATNKNVRWSSSDESVVKVVDGEVSAINEGNATITVVTEDGNKSFTCDVTVVISVASVTLNLSEAELEKDDVLVLTVEVNPENATNDEVIWESSDESVARVDNGIVVGLRAGVSTISVSSVDGAKSASCVVNVYELDYVDLSDNGSANSYIVSGPGNYRFPMVKGNSEEPVGNVASVEVLWETFGTTAIPKVSELISKVRFYGGCVWFRTALTFKEGNALIAAKDSNGDILWSWHIWMTDAPMGQKYNNEAGVMLDRNLGATSASVGNVGALGLLYQWGRKDPFLSSSDIDDESEPASTIVWPDPASSDSFVGTIEYTIHNPTTFVLSNINNKDWYYTGSEQVDNTRWGAEKTIYDPCPSGWKVPEGGADGFWSQALGSDKNYRIYTYDSVNSGILFTDKLTAEEPLWYPSVGCKRESDGKLTDVGSLGKYWSVTPRDFYACVFYFSSRYVFPNYDDSSRALALPVRCVKE